jgi:transposase
VIVANARKLRAIYSNNRKSDELDAQMLAKLGRVDPSLLHPIAHQSEQAQIDLSEVTRGSRAIHARPLPPESDLRRSGLKLAERGGRAAKKKAVVATARKLGVLLHTLWTRQIDYIPVRSVARAEAERAPM